MRRASIARWTARTWWWIPVGILAERRKGDFARVHAEGAGRVGALFRCGWRGEAGADVGHRRRSARRAERGTEPD